jgi:Domain of unknown function (DUF4190)
MATGVEGEQPVSTDPTASQRRPPPPPAPPVRTGGFIATDVWTPPKTNPMAIASLALSLFWLGGLGSVGAVVLGHMAKREIARSQGRQTGANLATAGLVIGYIGLVIMALYLLIYVAALANA